MKIINNEKSSEYSVIDLINTTVVTFYASLMLEKNIRTQNIENEVKKYANGVKKIPNKISSI